MRGVKRLMQSCPVEERIPTSVAARRLETER
jgi:hypothetical protein